MKRTTEGRVEVPRLNKGKGYAGPEYVGCMNTGARVAIMNSKIFNRYLVGTELEIAGLHGLSGPSRQVFAGKRVIRWSEPGNGKIDGIKHVIYAFKGRAAAVAKFHELNEKVLAFNRLERERIAKYNEAVRMGDMTEALRYAD
jgi:hypothetical protein